MTEPRNDCPYHAKSLLLCDCRIVQGRTASTVRVVPRELIYDDGVFDDAASREKSGEPQPWEQKITT